MNRFRLLISSLLVCALLAGCKEKAAEVVVPVDPEVRYGKLGNGLTYYIRHNERPENAADFYIVQRVGSMQEEDNQLGLAHFLEHMAFNGTVHFPGRSMIEYLEQNGAKFGVNINAQTSYDETVYNLSDIPVVREGLVDSCLLILHDWSGFITLDQQAIDKERLVVKEEWRTRNTHQTRIFQKLTPVLFEGSRYANRMPIGDMDIIENFTRDELVDYYKEWYRPDLQAVIVVGSVDVDAVEEKIKTLFSDIPAPGDPSERVYYTVPDNKEPIVGIEFDPELSAPTVEILYKHTPDGGEGPDNVYGLYKKSVEQSIIQQALNSRFAEMVYEPSTPFAAAGASYGNYSVSKTTHAWSLSARSKDVASVTATIAALIRENERVKQFGFTYEEINRAKTNVLASIENAYNNRESRYNRQFVSEYVDNFIVNKAIPGIEYEYEIIRQIAPSITVETINREIQNTVRDKNLVVVITGAEKDKASYPGREQVLATIKQAAVEKVTPFTDNFQDKPLMAELPRPGRIIHEASVDNLGASVWTLSNGIKVYARRTNFESDAVYVSGTARGGRSLFGPDEVNDNTIINAYAAGGLGEFNRINLGKALTGKNASVSISQDLTTQSIGGASNQADMETLFQLIHLEFTAPRKDRHAFDIWKEELARQLEAQEGLPNTVFADTLNYMVYGHHPYQKRIRPGDVAALDYDSLFGAAEKLFSNPGSYVFVIVGNFYEERVRDLVEQYLGSLPAGVEHTRFYDTALRVRKGRHTLALRQKLESPVASVNLLYSGMTEYSQKNMTVAFILQNLLDIAYTNTLREAEGGTYGANTSVSLYRDPKGQATIAVNFDTAPGDADRLKEVARRELQKIASQGPDEADLGKVKEYLVKNFQQNIQTNNYWLSTLLTYGFYGEDQHAGFMQIINSVSANDIRNFTDRIISQNNYLEIVRLPE